MALVTGAGCRRGIGAAICRALAGRGADVFLAHWQGYNREMPWGADEDGPETLLEELRRMGVRAEGMETNLSRPDPSEELLDAVAERLGPPSILVNKAPLTRPATATRSSTPPSWTPTTRST